MKAFDAALGHAAFRRAPARLSRADSSSFLAKAGLFGGLVGDDLEHVGQGAVDHRQLSA
jgi:hypothetical protein